MIIYHKALKFILFCCIIKPTHLTEVDIMDITHDIKYIGVNDHAIDLFEGQYAVPNGMSYNSFFSTAPMGRSQVAAMASTSNMP